MKADSQLLARANEENYYVMIYRETPVVHLDKATGVITFKHNGWHTRATASAMNHALDDVLGKDNHLKVSLNGGVLHLYGDPIRNDHTCKASALECN